MVRASQFLWVGFRADLLDEEPNLLDEELEDEWGLEPYEELDEELEVAPWAGLLDEELPDELLGEEPWYAVPRAGLGLVVDRDRDRDRA